MAKDAGIKWKKNALRHSFCSYRLALIKNAAQVAYEAGNNATMIHRHYHQLVRPADAKSWFAIKNCYGFPTPAGAVLASMLEESTEAVSEAA